jgi:putative transposase
MTEELPMKKTRFTEAQIMDVQRQMESGVPTAEPCRGHGMSSPTICTWRAKYGRMDASMMSEMKALAEKNRRLKRRYADVSMQNDLLKEALGKK